MKYVASVSFGKDSLAMLLCLLDKKYPLDEVLFYDTGMEYSCIYKIRDKIIPLLKEKNIKFTEIKPNKPFEWYMFDKEVKYKNKDGYHYGYGWCGASCRWGTTLKIRAINKYKRSFNEPVIDYVGIAADETQRFEKAINEGKRMPLVDWGMKESDCLDYCHKHGFYWMEDGIDLYSVLDRVSCWCCRNKNLKELKNIYQYLPRYWEKLKIIEEKTGEPMKGKNKSLVELEKRYETLDNK